MARARNAIKEAPTRKGALAPVCFRWECLGTIPSDAGGQVIAPLSLICDLPIDPSVTDRAMEAWYHRSIA